MTLGSTAVAAGVLASALYVVLLRYAPDADILAAVGAQLAGGALALIAIASIVHGPKTIAAILALPPAYLIATLAAGPLLDYAPYLLLTHASRFVSASATGMAFNLAPLWATALSAIFLSERLDGLQIAGGALVLAAAFAYRVIEEAPHEARPAESPACRT